MSLALAHHTHTVLAARAPVLSIYDHDIGIDIDDRAEHLGVYARMRRRLALQYLALRQRAARQLVSDRAQQFRTARRVRPDHSKFVARVKGLQLGPLARAQPMPDTVAEMGDSPVVPSTYIPEELELPVRNMIQCPPAPMPMPLAPPPARPTHRRAQSDIHDLCAPLLRPAPSAQPRPRSVPTAQAPVQLQPAPEDRELSFDYMFRAPRMAPRELPPLTPSDGSQSSDDVRTPDSADYGLQHACTPPRIKRKLSQAFPEERRVRRRTPNPQVQPREGWF